MKEEGCYTLFFHSLYLQLKRIFSETEIKLFNTIRITLFVSNTVNISSKILLQREDSNYK